ncbi:TPA: ATP-binding cassette domain-containing protein [Candidatus Poribacteria bacterium]|nr:ATP-binding cassette domain-containing protein [Candidatus Poribacteria bacterium]
MCYSILLEAKELSFRYPDETPALNDVNVYIKQAEAVAILGANGAGKTTLLKHFVGLLNPTRGEVFVAGKPIRKPYLKKIYQQVGFVFQNPDEQLFAPTVAEDVGFGPFNLGLNQTQVQNRVGEALKQVGLEDMGDKLIHHLSWGQKKRAAIAGVLAMRPKALILDEPTAGLDPKGADELLKLLHRLKKSQGLTLLISTHEIDRVPLYADRVYVMRRGEIASYGDVRFVFSQSPLLKECHLRPPIISQLFAEVFKELHIQDKHLPMTLHEAKELLQQLISNLK